MNTKLIGCHAELQIRGFEIALVATLLLLICVSSRFVGGVKKGGEERGELT